LSFQSASTSRGILDNELNISLGYLRARISSPFCGKLLGAVCSGAIILTTGQLENLWKDLGD
jgi:hypothetical protein